MRTLATALVALFVAAPAVAQQTVGDIQIGGGNPFLMKKAGEHVSKLKANLKLVLGRVEEARNEKDIVKLNCINEKLAQIKQILGVAEGAQVVLQEAIARRDGSADAQYSKIAIARGKSDQLRAEAEECVGQLAFVVDEKTSVEVQQPEGMPAGVQLATDSFGGVGSGSRGSDPYATGKGSDSFTSPFGGYGFFAPPPPVRRPVRASEYLPIP